MPDSMPPEIPEYQDKAPPRGPMTPHEAFGGRLLARKGFWAGRGGLIITVVVMLLVVALLVGWVLLWVHRSEGPSITLLTMGCVGFAAVLMLLATIQNRLTAYWKLREAQAAYLAGVSHNLRTPISAIRAAAQTLENPHISDENREKLLHAIVLETRLLGLRVDNVLETGRLEVERTAFENAPVSLSGLLNTALETPREIVASRGGVLHQSLEEEMWVRGDSRALRLVVDNLLDNAIKYADGAPQITVSVCRDENYVRFQVADSGLGLAPSDTSRAFRRFWRGSIRRSGTGLGLSLSKAIVRGHRGKIKLSSEGLGQGTTVTVWLPYFGEN